MIRRDQENQWRLFTQDDHAILAWELGKTIGGVFARSRRWNSWLKAVRLHDCGWPLHDQRPTINRQGSPRDVFESTAEIACRVWTASADGAVAEDDYAGLLVSLHLLSLSAFAIAHHQEKKSTDEIHHRQEMFLLNQFQHNEIERQHTLRKKLGLRTDHPLHYGLAPDSEDVGEEALLCDLKQLQLMDQLSLAALCTTVPFPVMTGVPMHAGGAAVSVQIKRLEDGQTVTATPWPFARPELVIEIPSRVLPAERYENDAAFQQAIASCTPVPWSVRLLRS